ncbi:MAG: ribosome maturation factor RimM [Armatimonadetes bacterium]|nr:ribosome maturation factor RimM [Armatimonadota bacterium]
MSARKKVTIVTDELREWTQPIGVIVATHGLKGAVKVRPLHGAADQLFTVGSEMCAVLPSGRRQKLTIQTCYAKGSTWIVKFAEIEHIDLAENYVGLQLAVHKDWKPKLKKGEFLLSELLGMTVVTEEGEVVGEVVEVMESPAHDLLVTDRGLIPMRREFIKKVDRKKRQIVVNLPKGLLSEEVPKKRRPLWRK